MVRVSAFLSYATLASQGRHNPGQVARQCQPHFTARWRSVSVRAGPVEYYDTPGDEAEIPFYALKFDKDGKLENQPDSDHLFRSIDAGAFTDVYLFSHGWNNNEEDALKAYDEWIRGFIQMRSEGGYEISNPYKPVLVGVIWPSKWDLSWRMPWSTRTISSLEDSKRTELVEDLATLVTSPKQKDEFKELGMKSSLEKAEYLRMFELMAPLADTAQDDEVPRDSKENDEPASMQDIADAFCAESQQDLSNELDITRGLMRMNPLLLFSFWQMRGRAATVGTRGVHPLLLKMLQTKPAGSPPKIHLLGHSFGARVVLAAVATNLTEGEEWPRKIHSMLLMQPAVVHTVFNSSDVGVYRQVLDRTKSPILSTYSNQDDALRTWFHKAVRIYSGKKREETRSVFLSSSDIPPDKYAALGGYPPTTMSSQDQSILPPKPAGTDYDFPESKVCTVTMHDVIGNHTDISKPDVYWLLYSLVAGRN